MTKNKRTGGRSADEELKPRRPSNQDYVQMIVIGEEEDDEDWDDEEDGLPDEDFQHSATSFAAGTEFAPPPDLSPLSLTLQEEDAGLRLDKALAMHLPQFSRSRLQTWLEQGHILIDGKPARAKHIVSGDEEVEVIPQIEPQHQAFTAQEVALDVVYQDDSLLVLHKPAGLVVHPGAGNWSGTLLNGLLHAYPELANVPRAGIVHRLDKDTSGLMVVAKTLEAHIDLVRQLQARSVKREYLALVWGRPRVQGTIDAAMSRHPRDRIKMAVSKHPDAKAARTHYHALASGECEGKPVALVRCSLETGRTHQIRVHMSHLGFPLVGDNLYGKPHLQGAFTRQALHAQRLGLVHPASGEAMQWEVALPQDMQDLLQKSGIDLAVCTA
ncbi:RluA family pseudouridine synthase [Massilia sp. W12]|uniref:RluA family pseudouridine synthase n=1 Tax=Massilia sp. W12 TaxID=3126507 RepID=UPI0030D2AA7E